MTGNPQTTPEKDYSDAPREPVDFWVAYFLPVDNIESEKSLPYVKIYKMLGDVPVRYNTILEVKIKDAKNG